MLSGGAEAGLRRTVVRRIERKVCVAFHGWRRLGGCDQPVASDSVEEAGLWMRLLQQACHRRARLLAAAARRQQQLVRSLG